MDAEMTAAIAAIMPLLETLFALGVPGILVMLAAIPAIVIALVCWLNYRHEKTLGKVMEVYRAEMQESVHETQRILLEVSGKHAEVVEFYNNNVNLVKNHERMNESLQTLIVNNTRALEHLSTIIETRDRK